MHKTKNCMFIRESTVHRKKNNDFVNVTFHHWNFQNLHRKGMLWQQYRLMAIQYLNWCLDLLPYLWARFVCGCYLDIINCRMIVYYIFITILRLVGAVVQYGCIREGLLVWHWYVVDKYSIHVHLECSDCLL